MHVRILRVKGFIHAFLRLYPTHVNVMRNRSRGVDERCAFSIRGHRLIDSLVSSIGDSRETLHSFLPTGNTRTERQACLREISLSRGQISKRRHRARRGKPRGRGSQRLLRAYLHTMKERKRDEGGRKGGVEISEYSRDCVRLCASSSRRRNVKAIIIKAIKGDALSAENDKFSCVLKARIRARARRSSSRLFRAAVPDASGSGEGGEGEGRKSHEAGGSFIRGRIHNSEGNTVRGIIRVSYVTR